MKNDFSRGSVVKNIVNLALPMTLAQLINVLYNVIDRIYIGRIPNNATLSLTGMGLCMPIIIIVMAFSNLFGMGGAPLCSIARGQGELKEAENIMGNSFVMLVASGILLTVAGLLFKKPMLYLFGASDATFSFANEYITVYLCGSLFVMVGLGMNSFINSQGFGKTGMASVLIGAIINIILDPIFIFVFHMGIRGAALATVISQALSALWILLFLTGKRSILRLNPKSFRLKKSRVKEIIALGMSGFTMSMTNSLVQIVGNATLQGYGGDLYVGVMTVINSIREVVSMPVMGVANGSQPIMGFNYGAKEFERVKTAIRFTAVVCITYTTAIWGILHLFPAFFIRIFNSTGDLLQIGIPAMRVYFFGFFMMAFQFVGQSVFVALKKSKQAIFFSIFRKVVIVIPLTILLPKLYGLGIMGVFLAEPISNFIGGVACFGTMRLTVWKRLSSKAS